MPMIISVKSARATAHPMPVTPSRELDDDAELDMTLSERSVASPCGIERITLYGRVCRFPLMRTPSCMRRFTGFC